ncbi:queuosine precursor transporter [Chloroflexota bacterium]
MFNIWFWFLFLLIDLSLAVLMYRLWGKKGLYTVIAASIIVANIQVVKTVQLFGMVATLGNILYGSLFFATDVLSEVYGKKSARRGVWLGFCAMVLMTIWMQLALKFVPDASDFVQGSLETIFGLMPRIAAGSLVAYLLSQHHDVLAFHYWKAKTKSRYLWLRNCASTAVSQAIDSVVFCAIAFIGVFPWPVFLEILLTTYFLKFLVMLFDTPFIYWAKSFSEKVTLQEEAESLIEA